MTPASSHLRTAAILLAITFGAILLHGYHFGVQDQFVYIPAVKHHLNPALYPGDTEIFQAQTRWMLWDEIVAMSIRVTRLPFEWAIFLWQVVSIFMLLLGCREVARRCFAERAARWAGVVSVAVMLMLVAGGSMLFLADPYLHPRTLATAFLLLSFAATLDRKWIAAVAWLALAGAMHPTLALIGALHLLFQAVPVRYALAVVGAAFVVAFFTPGVGAEREAWREVLESRWFLFPLRWPWFAWFGVVVPLGLMVWWSRLGDAIASPTLRRVSSRLFFSGAVGVTVAFVIPLIPALERWIPLESMRVLHLLMLLTVLFGGALLETIRLRRWLFILLIPAGLAMLFFQFVLYPGSPHIEWPGTAPCSSTGLISEFPVCNKHLVALQWVKTNTPVDARFALDPRYLEVPDQDFHDFRAIGERPALMNYSKDRAVAANFPALAPAWREQMRDLQNWKNFKREDFERLREKYGVTWIILYAFAFEPPVPFDCPYRYSHSNNSDLIWYICRIP